MTIKYTEGGLRHCKRKHNINKKDIMFALSRGIYRSFNDKKNNSIVLFAGNLCICIDKSFNLKTAFVPDNTYEAFMEKHCKEIKIK